MRSIRKTKMRALLALSAFFALAIAVTAAAEPAVNGNLFVSFHGGISPTKLPRDKQVPVSVQMGGKIKTTDGTKPPKLDRIILDINSHGSIDTNGLPTCPLSKLQNASSKQATKLCGDAQVGHGNVTSRVGLPGQGDFATNGPLLAFNGKYKGKPAIFAQVNSKSTLAVTYVIVFQIKSAKGKTFGSELDAKLPSIASGSGYISAFDLSLKRKYTVHGQKRSYISANCPVPPGVSKGGFTFARSTYEFADGRSVTATLQRDCTAKG
jgi:hypothetical protein